METPTLSEYIDATRDTLRYWLDIHTNAQKWAEGWIIDDDPQYTLREMPVIKNAYFEFDIRAHVARHVAKDQRDLFVTCRHCGYICESGFEDNEDKCYRSARGKHSWRQTTVKELTQWLEELGEFNVSDEAIRQCLIKDGFKVYREALSDIIAPVVSEVKDCLKQFRGGSDKWLAAATWANHICHVHGNIVRDYGDQCGLDYGLVNRVSQESLVLVFGQDAIDEYLAD